MADSTLREGCKQLLVGLRQPQFGQEQPISALSQLAALGWLQPLRFGWPVTAAADTRRCPAIWPDVRCTPQTGNLPDHSAPDNLNGSSRKQRTGADDPLQALSNMD